VTENHSEIISAVKIPFSFPLLSVGGGWGGKKVRFESEEFNDRYTVRTDNPKLASDVIHDGVPHVSAAAGLSDRGQPDALLGRQT
jgi:hypothetical protein